MKAARAAGAARPFRKIVNDFVQHWRTLGRVYDQEAWVLKGLCKFLEASNRTDLDQAGFEAWCTSRQHTGPSSRRNAQLLIRRLCLYRQRTEPGCFVPDPIYFIRRVPCETPVIVDPQQMAQLLDAIAQLPSPPVFVLRNAVLRLSFVLLYTAGLRRRELVRLTLADIDTEKGVLAVRESKFSKTRFLPLSHDALSETRAYLKIRLAPGMECAPKSALIGHYTLAGKFIGYGGTGLGHLLIRMVDAAQIHDAQNRRPRLHDFRHSFAVQALLRWYRDGADVQAQLPKLAMYMGHVSIVSTEHYLHWIPEIAAVASQRFEAQCGRLTCGESP